MESQAEFSGADSSPNSSGGNVAILPVDSWSNLEAIKRAVIGLRAWVVPNSEGWGLLDAIEENTDYLIKEGEKEAAAALAWAASL